MSPLSGPRGLGATVRVRTRRLPLRWRVAVAFALVSSVITGTLALATWKSASEYMLAQRQQSAFRQAYTNVQLVRTMVNREGADLADEMEELRLGEDATLALRTGERWTIRGRSIDPGTLPAEFLAEVPTPDPPERMVVGGLPVLGIALPVPDRDVLFVQLFPLAELSQALRFLALVLVLGLLASVVFGLLLGRWAADQALRPLAEFTRTAGRVAGGDWRARLPAQGDPDLAPLAALFNRTTDALEQRVARDARFAGDVSHELRSPLTTMINAVEVLNRRGAELSDTARLALRLLTTDLERLHKMVVDLLEIARDHAAADDGDLEPCDLADLVRHAVAGSSRAAVAVESPEPPPVVLADRRRLDRVVANMLDNADRHAGGVVRVAVLRDSTHARLVVDDAGPGIPEELRQQVFERFTRGAKSGDRGSTSGTGLGLALVADHVRFNHGRVWMEGRPGGGSRFIAEFPLADDIASG